jgi:hypothetical protein
MGGYSMSRSSEPFAHGKSIVDSQCCLIKAWTWSYLAGSRSALSAMIASVSGQRAIAVSRVAYLRKLVPEPPCWLEAVGDACCWGCCGVACCVGCDCWPDGGWCGGGGADIAPAERRSTMNIVIAVL